MGHAPSHPEIHVEPKRDSQQGGNGGKDRDILSYELIRVTVWSTNEAIVAFSFTYRPKEGEEMEVGPWGADPGHPGEIKKVNNREVQKDEFPIGQQEYLTKIEGTYGDFYDEHYRHTVQVITSLNFKSNKKERGPFGRSRSSSSQANSTTFSLPDEDGRKIVSFHGRSGNLLDALGVYTETAP